MSDISDGYASPYGEKQTRTKLFIDAMDFVDKKIIFKACPKHTELRYAGDKCPVCALEEERIRLYDAIASLQILQATATAE